MFALLSGLSDHLCLISLFHFNEAKPEHVDQHTLRASVAPFVAAK
jgi:hypothetical protein